MRLLTNLSLAKKILGIELAVLGLTLTPGTFVEIRARTAEFRAENNERVSHLLGDLAQNLASPLWNYSKKEPQEMLQNAARNPLIAYVAALDSEGKLLAEARDPRANTSARKPSHSLEIQYQGKKVGTLIATLDVTEYNKKLSRIQFEPALRNIIATLLIAGMTFIFLRIVVIRRIEMLEIQAKRLSQNKLSKAFHWETDDEIGRLGASLNEARSSLKAAFLKIEKTNKDLAQLNKNLEDKVAQKTAEVVHNSRLASLGEMSAGIAHEINNPLAVIEGNARALGKITQESEGVKNKLSAIERAAHRIAKIVLGLRKFSRTSAQGERQIHSLKQLITEALVLMEGNSRRNGIPILFECDGEGFIPCNDIEIEQVIVNLVNNGVDAVKNLEEKWVKLTMHETESQVILQVRDAGKGISNEMAGKLFQPFFTTKPVGEGTGLGLSIVKGILENHGAKISLLPADSNTCFELVFPKAAGAKNAA